jgi:anti-anti-sigma factor
MQITTKTSSNGTVLELNGRFVRGMDLVDLHNAVRDAARTHPSRIVLNLANVTDVDFGCIGELVKAFKHVKNQGGHLVLTNLPRRVGVLLETAKLMPIFEVSKGKQVTIVNSGQQMSQRQLCC